MPEAEPQGEHVDEHIRTDAIMRVVEGEQPHFSPNQWQHIRACDLCRERFVALMGFNILIKESRTAHPGHVKK